MASNLAKNDADLVAQLDVSANNIRTVMMFAREMRGGDFVINAETMRLVEDWLFIIGMDLTGFRTKLDTWLAEYRHIAEAASDAVLHDDALPLPPFCNLVVYTGSYRPVPANDQLGGVA